VAFSSVLIVSEKRPSFWAERLSAATAFELQAASASNSAISVQLRQKMLKDFEILGLQSRSSTWQALSCCRMVAKR
jgi:hypothetical protein